MSLAAAIKALRSERKLTQKQLAEACGVTQAFIARLETGTDADLRSSTLYKLCDALGVSADHFRPYLAKVEGGATEEDSRPGGKKN